jgi:hypothetical protein
MSIQYFILTDLVADMINHRLQIIINDPVHHIIQKEMNVDDQGSFVFLSNQENNFY